jgi:hypothetical protein
MDNNNIRDMVISAFDNVSESGFIAECVKKNIESTVKSIVEDCFRSYGDFGRELEKKIKSSVLCTMDRVSLPEYNKLVINMIQNYVDEIVKNDGLNRMKEDLEKLLCGENKEWKLSEIIEEMKSDSEDDAKENDWYEISLHIKDDGMGFIHIDIDPEPDKERWECRLSLMTYKDELANLKFKGKDFSKQFFIGDLYGFEKTLFQIYSRRAKIICDEPEVSKYYSHSDDEY